MNRLAFTIPLFFFGVATCATADPLWAHSSEYSRFHIVVSDEATPAERNAAQWFQRHWNATTGHQLDISNEAKDRHINVWVGTTDNPYADTDALPGNDGIVIKTFSRATRQNHSGEKEDRHITLYGGSPRGTMHAEWEFFKRYMGIRWLSHEDFHVPPPPDALPVINFRYEPPFWYRDISYRQFVSTPWMASQARLNGFWSGLPEEYGGHISYVDGFEGSGHTFHEFVSPEDYFDDHPEYFAEIDRERRADGQLCLTNPEVLHITIDVAREKLRNRQPHERILSVSQMDFFWYDSWCTCASCAALDKLEGGQSGTIIHFVNAVAEALEDEFPDVFIDTFAYQYSRKPPKHVRPRSNVIVRLCNFEVDFSRPLADRRSKRNRAFVKDLKQWSRIADNLFVWDYTQNWHSHQGPHPNIHVLQPNIKLFAKMGVDGVFEQASWESPHSDYEFLKAYILEHALWNPGVNWKNLYDEFLTLYFAEAAPYIRRYQNLIRNRTRHVELSLNDRMTWMDYDTVTEAQAIFDEAFAEIEDPTLRERLGYAYLPVQYAALVCPPKVFRSENAYTFIRPPSQSFDEYWDMLMRYGVTRLEDWPIEAFRERLNGKTPPRYETQPILKVGNDQMEIWLTPGLGGKIVRMDLKAIKHEWLNGYTDPLNSPSTVNDRIVLDQNYLTPIDESYTVVDHTDTSITLQVTLPDGIQLTRQISISPDRPQMEIKNTYTNTTDDVLSLEAQLRPAWNLSGRGRSPKIWSYDGSQWKKGNFDDGPRNMPPNTTAYWAVRIGDHTLTNEVRGSSEVILQSYPGRNTIAMNVNLAQPALSPGKSATVSSTYTWSRRLPGNISINND